MKTYGGGLHRRTTIRPCQRCQDQLVITRMDRLGRSVLHLVILGAALSERDVGLRVLE
ncbi:recombinase family protein [Glutamicibacter sp. 287]|uniref:recombinase family protein n=1 Tax=unclassified Glutamicibacter TaxID=2627139 RepID=UPI0031BA6F68